MEVVGVINPDTTKVAAHLPTVQITLQNMLEASLLKVTVIMFDLELTIGGAIYPVWLT